MQRLPAADIRLFLILQSKRRLASAICHRDPIVIDRVPLCYIIVTIIVIEPRRSHFHNCAGENRPPSAGDAHVRFRRSIDDRRRTYPLAATVPHDGQVRQCRSWAGNSGRDAQLGDTLSLVASCSTHELHVDPAISRRPCVGVVRSLERAPNEATYDRFCGMGCHHAGSILR